ncbi:MAG: hypothetical protein ACQXXD_03480 [Thermoplasmatota archaeon]|jgi:hypothetical protein
MDKNVKLKNFFNTDFIKNNDNEEVDDFTFSMWKSELQRELRSFWKSI